MLGWRWRGERRKGHASNGPILSRNVGLRHAWRKRRCPGQKNGNVQERDAQGRGGSLPSNHANSNTCAQQIQSRWEATLAAIDPGLACGSYVEVMRKESVITTESVRSRFAMMTTRGSATWRAACDTAGCWMSASGSNAMTKATATAQPAAIFLASPRPPVGELNFLYCGQRASVVPAGRTVVDEFRMCFEPPGLNFSRRSDRNEARGMLCSS